MNWKLKLMLQKLISALPFDEIIYKKIQNEYGRLKEINIRSKLNQADRILKGLEAIDYPLAGKECVEIGAGWVFTVPFYFLLKGAKSLTLFDIDMKVDYLANVKALQQFKSLYLEGNEESIIDIVQTPTNKIDFINTLKSANIFYNAPKDFIKSGLEDNSKDIVYSVTVFEHIPYEILLGVLKESNRVLKKGGIIMHLIDMGDHYAHTDPNISPINFLQFDDKKFSSINHKYLYQNRLRASDFKRMFIENGFEIEYLDPNINPKSLEAYDQIHIDQSFKKYSKEDICTSSVCIIASKI